MISKKQATYSDWLAKGFPSTYNLLGMGGFEFFSYMVQTTHAVALLRIQVLLLSNSPFVNIICFDDNNTTTMLLCPRFKHIPV